MIKGSGHKATKAHGDHRNAASSGVGRSQGMAGVSLGQQPLTQKSTEEERYREVDAGSGYWTAKLEVEAEDRWQAVWSFWGAVHTSCNIFG